jgi:hypothetical protein
MVKLYPPPHLGQASFKCKFIFGIRIKLKYNLIYGSFNFIGLSLKPLLLKN